MVPSRRRIIRKVATRPEAGFEDALWPTYLALTVLGGFLWGVVFVYWLGSGWFWPLLLAVPAIIGGLMFALRWVNQRWFRRSVQFSLVVAVVLHVVLMVWMERTEIFGQLWVEEDAAPSNVEKRPPVTIALTPQLTEEEQQDFQRPLETQTPQPAPQELPRPQKQKEAPEKPQVEVQQKLQDKARPNVMERKEVVQAPPRQAEQPSKLSRSQAAVRPLTSQSVSAPQLSARAADRPAKLQTKPVQVQRRTRPQAAPRPTAAGQPPAETENSTIKIARRQSETAQPQTTAAATLRRRMERPRVTPRTQASQADLAAPSRRTPAQEITPANTRATRQTTTSPQITKRDVEPTVSRIAANTSSQAIARRRASVAAEQTPQPADSNARSLRRAENAAANAPISAVAQVPSSARRETTSPALAPQRLSAVKQTAAASNVARSSAELETPSPTSASSVARSARRQTQTSDSPQVAQTPRPAPQKTSTSADPRSMTKADESFIARTAVAPSPRPSPKPSDSAVSRRPAVASTAVQRRLPALAPTAASSTEIVRPTTARVQVAQAPSLHPDQPAKRIPARSLQTAQTTASPTSAESPALAVSTFGASRPSAEPAKMAISRARQGVAGMGRSENMDRSLPARASPAISASISANRAVATQNAPMGNSLAPSEQVRVRRSLAAAQAPSASLRAAEVEVPTAPGLAQPTNLVASASAAMNDARSDAAPAKVTAAKGTGDVDLGPTRIVSEAGASRASGGGQPELNPETQPGKLARAQTGGAPQVALASSLRAQAPAAPKADGGGAPATPLPNQLATAVARSNEGGKAPASGGPTTADEIGPLVEANTGERVTVAQVNRADAVDGRRGDLQLGAEFDDEDDEERRRRLRMRGGGSQVVAALSAIAPKAEGDQRQEAVAQLQPNQLAAQKQSRSGRMGPLSRPENRSGQWSQATGAPPIAQAGLTRAQSAERQSDQPQLGGEHRARARTPGGPAFAANLRAETLELEGAPQSSGEESGRRLQAQGLRPNRLAGGVRALPRAQTVVGAARGDFELDADEGQTPGLAAGPRASSPGEDDVPSLVDAFHQGGPKRRPSEVGLPGGAVAAVELDGRVISPSSPVVIEDADRLVGAADVGPLSRQPAGGLEVDISAPDGVGGLGMEFTPDVGVANRRALRDSQQVHLSATRFLGRKTGGLPSINKTAVAPTEAFRRRGELARQGKLDTEKGGGRGRPSPQTEAAIERGLLFLARHQSPDGNWSLHNFGGGRRGYDRETPQLTSDTAATGLALLAFQGAGYNHRQHKYKDVVLAGVNWLLQRQKPSGDLYVPLDQASNRYVWLYSHSIAALALCEAYGMTQDPELREPAQKALDFIVASQHKSRGGWRYSPGLGSDTSVTGWMMMALKSGQLAKLSVPQETWKKLDHWLDLAQASKKQKHLYVYNPYAPDTQERRHGRRPSKTMTSVGLLMRLYNGWQRDNRHMIEGAKYLQQRPPAIGTLRDPQRDTYYWYYGTQVMYHMGGDYWKSWNGAMHPLLVDTQVRQGPLAGSWDPRRPIPDAWGPHAGRIYVTTMNLLSLEVYYRHLPLYEEAGK